MFFSDDTIARSGYLIDSTLHVRPKSIPLSWGTFCLWSDIGFGKWCGSNPSSAMSHGNQTFSACFWAKWNRHTVLPCFFCGGGWLKPLKCENGMKIVNLLILSRFKFGWCVRYLQFDESWVFEWGWKMNFLWDSALSTKKTNWLRQLCSFGATPFVSPKTSWGSQRGIVGDWLGHPSGWRP